jgi:formate dehydrogenase subunit gamma
MSAARAAWSAEAARAVLAGIDDPGPVLIALQALQETFGYVHPDALPLVAEAFNVSRADVYGVLTYYRDLRTTMPAAVEVRVCMGEACQAVGARQLRVEVDELADIACDVSAVFCMGNCALGPTAVVNDRLIGRATGGLVRRAVTDAGSST